ncbi:MAG: recombination-associated protein RdgC [Planctomycetes bacterium]|nr:recombination-associated protein RdgC [Planctomycetota bacterium]
MLVGKGALSFRAFQVSGKGSVPTTERLLGRLDQFAFAGIDTVEEGTQHGWVAPDHLFDGDFHATKIYRGQYAVFALRIDTRKVRGPVLAAHTAIAIQDVLDAEGLERLPGRRKRDLKNEVKRELLAETPPVQRAYGVFWNVRSRKVYLQSTSKTVIENFRSLFERTFELTAEPFMPGLRAAAYAHEHGKLEALKDARPLALNLTKPGVREPELVSV